METMTTYQELVSKIGGVKKGRKRLSDEERAKRAEASRIKYRRRGEAKRRALFVLETKHKAEFERIFNEELEALTKAGFAEKQTSK